MTKTAREQERAMQVEHVSGDRWSVTVRGHELFMDQPEDDTAPTPVEVWVAALATCVAHYARRYLVRHNLPTEGLAVTAGFELAAKPTRVGSIELTLTVPEGVPAERREPLLAVASGCAVHHSLTTPPTVSIGLAP